MKNHRASARLDPAMVTATETHRAGLSTSRESAWMAASVALNGTTTGRVDSGWEKIEDQCCFPLDMFMHTYSFIAQEK